MTEEQHKRVNELALEVYQLFLEKYPEDMVHEEEEVGLVGTAYGYMLILATLGYKPDEMGQDAVEGVKKLMELVENEEELPSDIYESDSLGFTPEGN